MKIGIKIYPEDISYARKIARYCDFFEVMAIPGSDFHALKSLKKPFAIHCIHSKWGFNPSDPKKSRINRQAADAAKKAADILGADIIVTHPGYKDSEGCSIKHSISFLSRLDRRFIVENMPAQNEYGTLNMGGSVKEMQNILKKTKKRMCLDFPHAAEYAHKNNIYYIDFIKAMIKLKPAYFHISDTRIQNKQDLHLHLRKGNLNLWYFAGLLPDDARLTIETAHEFRKQHRDILILREQC